MAAVAMIPSPLEPGHCPKIKADGAQCGNKAGKATDHVGFGYCSLHGGRSPSGRKHGGKLMALAAMRDAGEVDVNPLDAMLYTVRRASHLAMYFRLQREAVELEDGDSTVFASLEREALSDLNQWADRAIKAGVAERQVRMAERMGERLSAAFETAIAALVAAGVELTGDQRMLAVRTYAGELARHEGGGDIQASAKDV